MKVRRVEIVYMRNEAYMDIYGAGNLQFGVRPLLVVSNDAGNSCSNIAIVVPLTRKNKRGLPTHFRARTTNSVVMCEQIFTINQTDVERIVGRLTDWEMNEVEKRLKVSLGIERG